MNTLLFIDETDGGILLIIISVSIVLSIMVFGAIMKIYDINNSLNRHSNSLKKQNEKLKILIELQKEQNELIKKLIPESATDVAAPCTTDKDTTEEDQS